MSISVVTSGVTNSGGNNDILTFMKPAASNGDLMVLQIVHRGNKTGGSGGLTNIPTDMYPIQGITNPINTGAGSGDTRMHLFTHRITPSSPASWTFTLAANDYWIGFYVLLRGVDTTAAVDGAISAANTLTTPSITTTVANTMLVYMTGSWHSGGAVRSYTPPSGMTKKEETQQSGSVGMLATEVVATAGATGTRTAIKTPTDGDDVCALAAFTPASGNVFAWNGSVWQNPTVKQIWDGSKWIQ